MYDNLAPSEGTSAQGGAQAQRQVKQVEQLVKQQVKDQVEQQVKQEVEKQVKQLVEQQGPRQATQVKPPTWCLPVTILFAILGICLVVILGMAHLGKTGDAISSGKPNDLSSSEATQATEATTTSPTANTTMTTIITSTTTASPQNIAVTGVALVGGYRGVHLNSTEMFPSTACLLPPLGEARSFASLSVFGGKLTLCGGVNQQGIALSSCIQAGRTGWQSFARMSMARHAHLSWAPASRPDTLIILGGHPQTTSAEELPGGAKFTLAKTVYYSCAVEDQDSLIVTGGYGSVSVTRYNATGGVEEEFADLPEKREYHACGLLQSDQMKVPFVIGGYVKSAITDSVLALFPRASSWKAMSPLPKKLRATGSVMVDSQVWVTGGYTGSAYNSDVFTFDLASNKWTVLGKIKQERYHHASVGIRTGEIECAEGEGRIQARIVTTDNAGDGHEEDIHLGINAETEAGEE